MEEGYGLKAYPPMAVPLASPCRNSKIIIWRVSGYDGAAEVLGLSSKMLESRMKRQ
jgi:hypothetical protein